MYDYARAALGASSRPVTRQVRVAKERNEGHIRLLLQSKAAGQPRIYEGVLQMNTKKLLVAAAAIALMAGTGGAFAQQEPAHGAAGEKLAPKTMDSTNGRDANLTFDTTPSDHARLREIFGKDRSVRRVDHVRFSLALGAVVPRSVRLAALPQTIIDIQPTWRGNEFFRVGHQILIVDPQSKEIVGVLSV